MRRSSAGRLQNRPTPLLSLIYCRCLSMRRLATRRTAACHVGARRRHIYWQSTLIINGWVDSFPVTAAMCLDGEAGDRPGTLLCYQFILPAVLAVTMQLPLNTNSVKRWFSTVCLSGVCHAVSNRRRSFFQFEFCTQLSRDVCNMSCHFEVRGQGHAVSIPLSVCG